jgi:acyl-CoA dehydrogenase
MYTPYFDETHDMLRKSVRTFIEREIRPHLDDWEDAEEFPRALYKKAAEAGFLGLGFPEELGGTPGDYFHNIAQSEEFVRCGSLGLVASLFSYGIGLPPILIAGTEEQQRRFIPPVLAGDKISALAITEPNAGSDVAGIQTRAVRDGDHYVVNGAKTFITSGCRADYLTTAVRTGESGSGGVSLLVICSDTPGYTVAKKIRKMGWDASDTAELVFEDCRVPVENLLGRENEGFKIIMHNFVGERIFMAVEACAAAQLAYEEALRYAQQRQAFGRTLAGFQVTRHKLADMATKIAAAREFNYALAAKVRAGEAVTPAEAAMAKNFSCEVCDKVVFDAVQVHGGYGYAREYLVERLYRDTRILSIGGGTTEIMKEIIAKDLGIG